MSRIRSIAEYTFRDFVPLFKMRDMIKYIRKNNGEQDLIGVEIGVNYGYNAVNMLKVLHHLKHLYLIDPYTEAKRYGEPSFRRQTALKNLRRFNDKVSFFFVKSEDAVDLIPDDLDFVYIDGNHNYEFVTKDIKLYYPKVKNGGVFGGEDFSPHCLGTSKAVIEFVENNNLRLLSSKGTDWWVIKKN